MALRIVDPGHVGLRRGIRAAAGTTIAMAIAIGILPGTPATVLAAFGSVALLGTADFGGSLSRRASSLLATGIAGAALVTVGGLAALNVVSIVLVTFLVTGTLAFLVVLRGSFAAACPALTTVYVASAMVTTSPAAIPLLLAGWGIAVAVALPITLVVLPRRDLAPVRAACVSSLRTIAAIIDRRGVGGSLDVQAAGDSLTQLEASYLGNPFRAAGLRGPDRALQVLVGQTQGLLAALTRGGRYDKPVSALPNTAELIRASSRCLTASADALEAWTGQGAGRSAAPPPSALDVSETWQLQWDSAVTALGDESLGSVGERVDLVDAAFPDRAMAIAVIRLNTLVRRVLGVNDETFDESRHSIPEPPFSHPLRQLRQQISLRSPWMRTALRTGVGLALATLVVEVVGLSHGFWVLLGVIATLRLDGLATVKTSLLALLGTFVGAVVGYGLLTVDMTHPVLLWIGLVLVAFLAVYTQATAAYIVGQAAFSLFVIVAFSISNWPPELAVADERFIDIAYGAAISTAVALLMWPRGVVSDLVSNVSDAIRRASRVLTDAVADFVDGGERVAPSELLESASAFVRSREVIEVTLSSRAPTAIERAHAWQDVIDHLRTLTVTGHLISVWSKDGPPLAAVVPALGAPLTADARTATEAWEHTAEMIDGAVVDECSPEFAFMASVHRAAGDLDLHDVEIANRVVGAVWSHGWISMTYHASISAQPPRVDS